ncbi:MAG TPA: hypothetical protein VGF90_03245 [Verrucomicrobiae bacterium]
MVYISPARNKNFNGTGRTGCFNLPCKQGLSADFQQRLVTAHAAGFSGSGGGFGGGGAGGSW